MDWRIWGPVVAGLGTLTEVRDRWTLADLLDAHEVLRARETLAEEERERGR